MTFSATTTTTTTTATTTSRYWIMTQHVTLRGSNYGAAGGWRCLPPHPVSFFTMPDGNNNTGGPRAGLTMLPEGRETRRCEMRVYMMGWGVAERWRGGEG
jgi:hypothetical protein